MDPKHNKTAEAEGTEWGLAGKIPRSRTLGVGWPLAEQSVVRPLSSSTPAPIPLPGCSSGKGGLFYLETDLQSVFRFLLGVGAWQDGRRGGLLVPGHQENYGGERH